MTLRLNGSSSGYTELDAPAAAGSNTITLPTSNGSANQFLKNSGTAGELQFSSMVEDSSGNLGLGGITSPTWASDGGIHLGDDYGIGFGDGGSGRPDFQLITAGDGRLDLRCGFGSDDADIAVESTGKLLIGSSSARTNWNDSSIEPKIIIEGAGNDDTHSLCIVANSGTTNSNSRGAALILARTEGTAIGSNTSVANGNLLGKLEFKGNDGTSFTTAAQISASVEGTPGTDDMPGKLVFSTTADGAATPTERMRISNDGAVRAQGVYDNTLSSSANVHVDSGGLIRRVTSSAKYKTNIETIEDSYADALLNCRPVWYQSTCEGDNPDYGWWGFIAEEVAEIDPRLVHWKTTNVTHDEYGYAVETPCDPEAEGVLYDRFVPHLVNLVKRQKATITAQQTQIDDLLARVTALEGA